MTDWPVAQLTPVARLRAVAARYSNAAIGEVVVDRPFDEVWAWMTDFERTLPQFDRAIARAQVLERDGDRIDLRVWPKRLPVRFRFDVTIEPGFCLMPARYRAFLVVMAAEPVDEGRTRYAHAEAIPLPGLGWSRRFVQREVDSDLRGVRRHLG